MIIKKEVDNMTVQECLNHYKNAGIKTAWMCPNLVDDINFGMTEYTATFPITRKLDTRLATANVTKHWIEDKQACICYDYQAVKPFSLDIYRSMEI